MTDRLEPPADLRGKIAQLMMVRIGSNLPPIKRVSEDEERVARLLDDCPVGGLILFNGAWPAATEALDRLQSRSAVPLLVASDIERGAGQQVAGLTVFPHQRAFVDCPDAESAIGEFCRMTAREALAAGIHATFGPVADVNTDPRNPIIATRAFGDDPERASRLVAEYVQAAEGAGLLTTAKHFPGHGDTHQDSHDATPRVDRPGETLRSRDLAPFRAAIDAGVSLVMTAHVEYPTLDPTGAPATLSKPILVDLLRGELGFDGVVCSDSMLMAGVRDRFATEGELTIAALNAGVDLLLDVEDPKAAVDAILAAFDRGDVAGARIEEAFNRIWRLKERAFSAPRPAAPDREHLDRAEAESERIATAATVVFDDADSLPLDPARPLTALLFKPHHRPTDPAEQPLADALRERFAAVRYFETGPEVAPSLGGDLLAGVPDGAPIVIAMIVKPAAWHTFGLAPSQHALLGDLLDSRPIVLACLGVESALDEFPSAVARVCTHSDVPSSQAALAAILAGSDSATADALG